MLPIEFPNRTFTVTDLHRLPKSLPSVRLSSTQADETPIEVMSESFTLVLSREVQRNTRLAADIAMEIATRHTQRDVWYINTYAGTTLIDNSLDAAHRDLAQRFPGTHREPSNLRIMNIPLGAWSAERIAEEIETNGRDTARPTLVLNAFEYASLTRGRRERMAHELLRLQSQYDATIVIFSHEMKKDLEPGFAGRGALGLIAPLASAVTRILSPMEHLMGSKLAEKPTLHEKQTHVGVQAGSTPPREEDALTPEQEHEIQALMEKLTGKPDGMTGIPAAAVMVKRHQNGTPYLKKRKMAMA